MRALSRWLAIGALREDPGGVVFHPWGRLGAGYRIRRDDPKLARLQAAVRVPPALLGGLGIPLAIARGPLAFAVLGALVGLAGWMGIRHWRVRLEREGYPRVPPRAYDREEWMRIAAGLLLLGAALGGAALAAGGCLP